MNPKVYDDFPSSLPEPILTENAKRILSARYLLKDENNCVIETYAECFWRVASEVARSSIPYFTYEDQYELLRQNYYLMMTSLDFLPNSPTLMNAGKGNGQQLAACFVLPLEDSLAGIMETNKRAALIHQSGGGTGFSLSRLRPKGDVVRSAGGVSSGPVSFLEVLSATTEAVKQGASRRGANLAMMSVHHPDIMGFIHCKRNLNGRNQYSYDLVAPNLSEEGKQALKRGLLESQVNNFNISVAVTDAFMTALEGRGNDEDGQAGESADLYPLINPRTGEVVDFLHAHDVWNEIVQCAWETGDPGLGFIDRVNNSKSNPVPTQETIETSNPCGEQFLAPNDACTLGSINLTKFVLPWDRRSSWVEDDVDWTRLEQVVHLSTHFLDDVLDANPIADIEIAETVQRNRRIGLGVMGWADMLIEMGIPYDSEEALTLGSKVMQFINDVSSKESHRLAQERGSFPNFPNSIYKDGPLIRNGTRTTVAPTGTISLIAGCSSGIEPLFALAYDHRGSLDGALEVEVVPSFERIARQQGFWTDDLGKRVRQRGTVRGMPYESVPKKWQSVFATAHDVAPSWHVRMQAAWQEHVDNSISKTINMPHDATIKDVDEAYRLAWDLGCKGITVYRDGCKEGVLHVGSGEAEEPEQMQVDEVSSHFTHEYDGLFDDYLDDYLRVDAKVSHPELFGLHSRVLAPRPHMLSGFTYETETPLGTAFITINETDEGEPFELFVNHGRSGSDVSPLSVAIGKLASMILRLPSDLPRRSRVAEMSRMLRDLGGASSVGFGPSRTKSLPDALAKVLEEYLDGTATSKVIEALRNDAAADELRAVLKEPEPITLPTTLTEAQNRNGNTKIEGFTNISTPGLIKVNIMHSGSFCPDCGRELVHEEGCDKCFSCGYSHC